MNETMMKIGLTRAILFGLAIGCTVAMNWHGSLESWHTLLAVLGITSLFVAPDVLAKLGWLKK